MAGVPLGAHDPARGARHEGGRAPLMAQPSLHLEEVRAIATTARLVFVGGVRADGSSQIHGWDHVAEKPEVMIDVPAYVLALATTSEHLVAGCSDGHIRVYSHKGDAVRDIVAH